MAKKIGIVCYPTLGGSGVVATELGIELAEKGYEIHFISTTLPFRLKKLYPNIYFHEVEVANYPVFKHPPYDLSLANKITEVINREKLDLIHAHYAVPHAICSIFAKQMARKDVKIVTTLHGTDITILGIDRSLNEMIRYAIEESDAVTAVSNSLKDQTIDVFNLERDIEVIYNFIKPVQNEFNQTFELKKQLGIKSSEKVLIHISNFREVKRVDDVVKVFSIVNKQIPAKLLLVGDGPEYKNVYDLVHQMELQDQVIFLGRQDNIHDLIAISDLKLLLSSKESFGLVLLEAMVGGIPCIGTNTGGIPEVITDGVDGYICNIGDVEEIANKAITLLTNDRLRESFSINAKKNVLSKFHANQIVKKYEDLYTRLLNH